MTDVQETAIGEAIENYANVVKAEIKRWRRYGSSVAARLDAPERYKADSAAADLASGVSLAIASGASLTGGAIDAMLLIASGLDEPYERVSDWFPTHMNGGATLRLKGALTGITDTTHTLPTDAIGFDPAQLRPGETQFRLGIVDATGYPVDIYEGTVEALAPDGQTEDVPVEIRVA